MSDTKKKSPNFSMRLSDKDMAAFRKLAVSLKRSRVDTIRILIREGDSLLPELRARATKHPALPAGRPARNHEQKIRPHTNV